ncbi:IS3 family transposase [Ilumatobacter sp.]|uniref:IS3 family transposase n=1 Tax=Ilumatobacter sp. TaxID=1967498 RepID=UPI003B51B815
MSRRRHTPEQIIRKLAEGHKLLAGGQTVEEVCRHFGIAESTWARWLNQYGGMKADDAKRLRELESENARLKKLLAEAELDKEMLKHLGRGKMVTPNRRRDAVRELEDRFGVSQRRACRIVGQHRSTQRLDPPPVPDDEAELREFLRAFAKRRPRWGWRRAAKELRRGGWKVNNKRVRRLWRDEGLQVPTKSRKKRLTGVGAHVGPMSLIAPNALWALDFQFDHLIDHRQVKILNVIDEYTREALAIDVAHSITADDVVACLDRLAIERGRPPAFVRFDNGPEFVAVVVAEWCAANGTECVFIDPGSPWQNAWIESFNSRLRDELLNLWQFDSLLEARVIIEDWRIDYNINRPHTAHGDLTPSEFAKAWISRHQPQPA